LQHGRVAAFSPEPEGHPEGVSILRRDLARETLATGTPRVVDGISARAFGTLVSVKLPESGWLRIRTAG
jgi:hypothetical protein